MSEAPRTLLPPKVVLYVTSGRNLLVIREPEFPDIGLQPPGGTIEAGEAIEAAALRELEEETGLAAERDQLAALGSETREFDFDGAHHTVDRHYFHVAIRGDVQERWTRWEMTPSSGGPPILFELLWLSLDGPIELPYGRDAFLPELRALLELPT